MSGMHNGGSSGTAKPSGTPPTKPDGTKSGGTLPTKFGSKTDGKSGSDTTDSAAAKSSTSATTFGKTTATTNANTTDNRKQMSANQPTATYTFKEGGKTARLALDSKSTVKLAEGSGGKVSDLAKGDVVKIVVGKDNTVTSITVLNLKKNSTSDNTVKSDSSAKSSESADTDSASGSSSSST